MNYKDKYLHYKKKYNLIKNKVINAENIKHKNKDNVYPQINNDLEYVFWLIDEARRSNDEEDIFYSIIKILEDIILFAKFNNIKTIISIGDSPSIFFKILDSFNTNNKFNFKYLPISGINLQISDKFLSSKLLELNDIINDKMLFNRILWVDFLSSGNTFIKFAY